MKFTSVLALLLVLFALNPASQALQGITSPQKSANIPQRIIVKFSRDSGLNFSAGKSGAITSGLAAVDEINRKYHVVDAKPFLKKRVASERYRFDNIFILTVPPGVNAGEVAAEYSAIPGVEYAEPEYRAELHTITNDTYLQHQWGLYNYGQGHYYIVRNEGYENDKMIIVYGKPDADIKAADIITNPPDNTITSVVAIIDTGVDIDHPDLEGKIWNNPREIADNDIDDDNNGYIDDIYGWDFSSSDDFIEADLEDNDPTDYYGHGTHCAGIVAAVTGNGIGIAGTSPNTKIMALKIFPTALTSMMARAVIYAANNGADVVSMSFGLPYRSYLLEDAISYAYERGVIVCASTGNSGIEEYNYPAAFDKTIAVGASTDSDYVAAFSTIGEHVDIVAPGLAILSLRADTTDMYEDDEPWVHIVGEEYYLASGTSMSGPMVAAVAAYLRSVSPGVTPQKAREILHITADDIIDPYGTGMNLPGPDIYSGYGRVNLMQALSAAPQVRAYISTPEIGQIVSGVVDITGMADGADFSSYILDYGASSDPAEYHTILNSSVPVTDGVLESWDTDAISGRYTIRLKVGESNEYLRTIFIANQAVAEIEWPMAGDTLSNIVNIVVDAFSPDFSHYVLDYGKGLTPTTWTEIVTATTPASGDIIAGWVVESLPEGQYTLRLSVYSTTKLEIQKEIQINIRSIFSSDNAWKLKIDGDVALLANYGDIDNDGANEIILGTDHDLQVFATDGAPDNSNPAAGIANNFIVPPAIGRLDGDDIDDFVIVGVDPAVLYGFRSGGPDFEFPLSFTPNIDDYIGMEYDFTTLFLKDINGDGRDEIHLVVVDRFGGDSYMFDTESGLIKTFAGVSLHLPLDMDNDGFDELYQFLYGTGIIRQLDYEGNLVTSTMPKMDGIKFNCRGMTAYDIDKDDRMELIAFGFYADRGYWLYAYDENLALKAGWPHAMGIDDFMVPTIPIFGDIDADGSPEYFCGNFDVSYSYVHAWNLDGTAFVPGNPDGFFTITPRPGKINMLVLSDVNNDGQADIIACTNDDLFFTYRVQRIYAWDMSGDLLDGFPIITAPEIPMSNGSDFRFVPTIGDIDNNGNIDLVMPTADSSLVFMDFIGMSFDSASSLAPVWRYNRRLNGIGLYEEPATAVDDRPSQLPKEFSLEQNVPNPFNPDTRIEFSLPAGAVVTINIYDILGRRVLTLLDETLPAGRHLVEWHGLDDNGKPVPSGIYLYNLKAGKYNQARKMVLIK
ncbi:MAG: S8 family serine peptidase [Candidatus Zixiibacteriota bacterium]